MDDTKESPTKPWFFYKPPRHQQPKDTAIPIYRQVPPSDEDPWAGDTSSAASCEGSSRHRRQEDAAVALTSRPRRGQQRPNTSQSHVCSFS